MSFDIKRFTLDPKPYKTLSSNRPVYRIVSPQLEDFSMTVVNIQTDEQLDSCNNESSLQARANHKNVLSFKGFTTSNTRDEFGLENKKYFILTEYFRESLEDQLSSRMANNVFFSLRDIKILITDTLEACCHLVENDIAHRDLRPSNIFFVSKSYKLGNFSEAVNNI